VTRLVAAQRLALPDDLAGRRTGEATDDVEQRRLARTVGTDDADDLSLRNRGGDIGKGNQTPEVDSHTLHLKKRRHDLDTPPPRGCVGDYRRRRAWQQDLSVAVNVSTRNLVKLMTLR